VATDFEPATEQPYAALVCGLMVSASGIHVITWITTHLLTQEGWKAELACLVDPYRTLYPQYIRARSGKVCQSKTDVVITEPQRQQMVCCEKMYVLEEIYAA